MSKCGREQMHDDFCNSYNVRSLIFRPTCFKNPGNPSCIDLVLTNSPYSFQSRTGIEADLSDFNKITVVVMKTLFQMSQPKRIKYRNYRAFSNGYREDLISKLSNEKLNSETLVKGALSGLRQFLATESSLKMMKNAFYFTSKALFVLKLYKFLS